MDTLVSTAWLAGHLGDDDLRVLDCTVILEPAADGGFRVTPGRAALWAQGHIPGAGFADLVHDLSDPESSLRFTLPPADRFAIAMGRLGVGVGTRVVLYDRRQNMWAARVWWMLRAFGFDDAAVLDGGWRSWTAEGRGSSTERCAHPPAVFHARPRPALFVGKEEVLASLDDGGGTCLVNALLGAQHRGEVTGTGRPGHIPGSHSVPATDIVDPDTHRYLPDEVLRKRFAPLLDPAVGRVVTYCGGGIAASSDAFVLWRLGKHDVAVYDASLQEWAADPALPLAVGD